MLDLNTMVRLLTDIWSWKPDARPEQSRRTPSGIVFHWQWQPGVRAVQRLRHLQLHDALFADLQRRTYIPGAEEDLKPFLRAVRTQAIALEKLLPCVDKFRLAFSASGQFTLLTKNPKEEQEKRLENDPEAQEPEEKEEDDESEGAAASG